LAALLWPAYAIFQGPLIWPFAAALAVAGASGLTIMLITLSDVLTIDRSRHATAARTFDLLLGLALAVPSLLGLSDLIRT
jgi:hypothetical protein